MISVLFISICFQSGSHLYLCLERNISPSIIIPIINLWLPILHDFNKPIFFYKTFFQCKVIDRHDFRIGRFLLAQIFSIASFVFFGKSHILFMLSFSSPKLNVYCIHFLLIIFVYTDLRHFLSFAYSKTRVKSCLVHSDL